MLRLRPEVIGPPDCPIIYRWTLLKVGALKLLLHRFPANADDRDVHDHPRPFWTFVLRGGYDDIVPTPNGDLVVGDILTAPAFRRRPACHAHRTRAHDTGAWTLVLMGPLRREWGFWRNGRWWFWKDYREEFGFAMQCEDLDKEYRK